MQIALPKGYRLLQILNLKSIDKDYDLSTYYEEVKQEIENYGK